MLRCRFCWLAASTIPLVFCASRALTRCANSSRTQEHRSVMRASWRLVTALAPELRACGQQQRRLCSRHHARVSNRHEGNSRRNNQLGIAYASSSMKLKPRISTQNKFIHGLPLSSYRSRNYSATAMRRSEHGKGQRQSEQSSNTKTTKPSKDVPSLPTMPQPSTKDDALFWSETLMRIVLGMGIAHCFDEYCFRLTHTEGPSMMPTIQERGEIVLMERFSYRIKGLEDGDKGQERSRLARLRQLEWETSPSYRHSMQIGGRDNSAEENDDENYNNCNEPIWHKVRPLEVSHSPNSSYEALWNQMTSPLSVGDVVVVHRPGREGTVCKRILGLPGDIVVMPRGAESSNLTEAVVRKRAEVVIGNMLASNRGKPSTWPTTSFEGSVPFTQNQIRIVPDGHIWLEGDNSLDSVDSRSYGSIPAGLVIGRVVCRVWPIRGRALLGRGGRPLAKGRCFNGSIVFPAGYEGERILAAKA